VWVGVASAPGVSRRSAAAALRFDPPGVTRPLLGRSRGQRWKALGLPARGPEDGARSRILAGWHKDI
jgi:hypothetical protein